MKKLLLSLLVMGVVGVSAFGASRAFFSDEEKSENNIFTAGAIDLKIDSTATINGQSVSDSTWTLKDLEPQADKFFNFTDIKPGDWGENTISMHVINNDAWACLEVTNLQNNENGMTEPEALVDQTEGGDLAQRLFFTAWADNGNNIWEAGEPLLFSNKFGPASDILGNRTYAIADSTTGTGPILGGELTDGSKTKYIGLQWCFGTMTVNEDTRVIACDAANEGNETQTDSLTADVSFKVVQAKNNPDFRCNAGEIENKLVLENKDPNYNRLTNDGIYGELIWAGDKETFDFTFEGYGLTNGTEYSLLYYADGWPGNNPGYWFGNATAVGGRVTISGNPDLGMDLPAPGDANGPTGAKIWLIPSSAYDTGTKSVTVWPFATDWLFESNLITYNDTNN